MEHIMMDLDLDRQTPLLVLRSAFDEIAKHLWLRDIYILGLLHRTLRHHPASHVELSLIPYLSKYTSEPQVFRETMRNLGCVISGSSALQFITRDNAWDPVDIDLYCPNQTATLMCAYLEGQGYVSEGGPWVPPDYPGLAHWVSRVVKYHRTAGAGVNDGTEGNTSYIDVIVSRDRSALSPITHYHSTAVMNFISADRVTSMYPSATFRGLSIQQHGTLSVRTGWFGKYAKRGYRHLRSTCHLPEGVSCGALCPHIKRTTLDQMCMHIFLTSGLGQSDNWREANWTLNAPPLDTVHCWNPNCANNDAKSIIPALRTFISSAKHHFLAGRECATMSGGDDSDADAETVLRSANAYDDNPWPGYRLDFYSLEFQVSTFMDQIQIAMQSEWALQQCTMLLTDIISRMRKQSAKLNHRKMGFFNHALATLDDTAWLSKRFRNDHRRLLTKFYADQEFLQKKNTELFTLLARYSPPLAAMRARDTHGYTLSKSCPSIMKVQGDLAASIRSLQKQMPSRPTQLSDIQLQTSLQIISEELHSANRFMNVSADRQTHLFREVQKLHLNSGLIQDKWDASKRAYLTDLRRTARETILPGETESEERDKQIHSELSQTYKETVVSLKDLWNTLNPEGAEPDTEIWMQDVY